MKTSATRTPYALLGSGQIARHLQTYLKLLSAPVTYWSRNGDPDFNTFSDSDEDLRLRKTVENATHVLLAVRDDAIQFLAGRIHSEAKTLVHFSGALNVPGVHACHPLMTFVGSPKDLEWYRSIPFVIDEGEDFAKLMPGLENPSFAIQPEQRPLYHALSSLAGNSTYLVWKKIGDEFENALGLNRAILEPFLKQAVVNALAPSSAALAGPVARQDWETVESHLRSLQQAPRLLQAYRGYLNLAGASGAQIPEALL